MPCNYCRAFLFLIIYNESMSTRRAKQLIYGTFYLLIVLIICASIYFVFVLPFIVTSTPVPCTPGTCAPTSTAPIAASIVLTFVTSPGHNTFLAQLQNANADFGAPLVDYELDFDDASDTVLQSIPGQSFIYPSQNKYILLPNETIPATYDHIALVVTGAEWLASTTIGVGDPGIAPGGFALQNIQTSVASTTVSVGGQLVNTGVASYAQVIVMALFKDGTGNIIGASQTELDNVSAGAANDFSVLYPAASNINPAVNQILVYAIR
jgi:hypothetical protein